MDYYTVLGLAKNSTPEEIKRAFKKKAMKHHPDKGGDSDAFKRITEAYEVLSNPKKRQEYDNPRPTNDFNFKSSNMDDIFSSMFRQDRSQQFKNRDITVHADLELHDCYHGKNLIIGYRLSNGKEQTVTVEIPPGAKHGDVIRYTELGDNLDPRARRGDLHVKIRIKKHSTYTREDNHIKTSVKLSAFDFMLGTTIVSTTPEGRNVRVTVPAGMQPNTTLSVQGYGIPDLHTGQRGNLYVTINCKIKKIYDEKLLSKIKELKDEIDLQS
mgnify:CR=1 FL=1